ncbi:hypothetical protein Trydic_g14142 [Trypoxylus dichotomus]
MFIKNIIFALILVYANSLPVDEDDSTSNSGVFYDDGSNKFELFRNTDVQYTRRTPSYVQQQYIVPVAAKVAPINVASGHEVNEEHASPKYQFQYKVEDDHTGDYKYHAEARDGDVVKGEYSFKEADGTVRTVKYTVESKSGFNAVVIKSGRASHPQVQVDKAAQRQTVRGPSYYDRYK